MNNKGFTLVELLATIIVLALVTGITIGYLNYDLGSAKEKTEEVFVDSVKDTVDMYLSSSFGNFKVDTVNACINKLSKKNRDVYVYKVTKSNGDDFTFDDVINSNYHPLTGEEFVNPANKDSDNYKCNVEAKINVYRDEDYVYYYSINKSDMECLNNVGGNYPTVITNLPKLDSGDYYTCG